MMSNASSRTGVPRTALRLVAFALATVLMVACGRPSPDELLLSAKQYLAKGDRDAAVIQLKNLLQESANHGEARLLLGQALLEADDYAAAEKELGRALELKQPHEKVVPLYVEALLAQGKYREVAAEAGKYKLFDKAAVAATQTAVGDAQLRLGSLPQAKEAYGVALGAIPGYPRARLGQAILLASEGRVDEALREADEVAAADPKLAEARVFKSDLLLVKGERAGAKKALEDAIAANPRYVAARLSLIRLATEDREFDAAARLVEETRRIAPRDLRLKYYEATLAFHQGKLDEARQHAQQVLRHLPDHVPSLILSGSIDLLSKRYVEAEGHLRRALARVPSHEQGRRMLVATQLQMGQPRRARESLQPLIDKGMPQDPKLLLLAGETFLANGEVRQASAYFDAAAKAEGGQEAAARTRRGQILLATGRREEGFRELEAAAELDATQYQADLSIITGHLRRNEVQKAMAAVQALEKKQPKNPLTFQMYGLVQLAARDMAAARRSFERALELQPNYLPAAQQLAMLDLAEKRPDDARKRYEAMIAKDSRNDQLFVALAEFLVRSGADRKEVAETLQRGIAANPQSPAPREALINFHLGNKEVKAALTVAQSALAVLPNDPQILYAAGSAQDAAGELNQAIESFNRLAAVQPLSPAPLLRLAAIHVKLNQTDKAIEALRRLQKTAPNDPTVTAKMVQVYLAAQRDEDALKEARELQSRQPRNPVGYTLEGEIHFRQLRLAGAERAFREALRVEPRADLAAVRLHEVLIASGKTPEADALAKKWLADNPNNVTMRLYLGERELAAKNLRASATHYRAAVAADPGNALALNNLAWISGELQDPKALEYAERALKAAPDNAEVLDTYGMLLLKAGRAEDALGALQRARQLAPARNDFRLHYAKALVRAGRKDEARKELQALQEVKEPFPGKDEVAGILKGL